MAAGSLPSSFARTFHCPTQGCEHKIIPVTSLKVRSQGFKDEGKSVNMVDANLVVLRRRIEGIRQREKLQSYSQFENGWNYHQVTGHDVYKKKGMMEAAQLLILASSSLGLVFLGGSLCICLVSFLVRLTVSQY